MLNHIIIIHNSEFKVHNKMKATVSAECFLSKLWFQLHDFCTSFSPYIDCGSNFNITAYVQNQILKLSTPEKTILLIVIHLCEVVWVLYHSIVVLQNNFWI